MANTKKLYSEKTRTKTFGLNNKTLDTFLDYCEVNKITPSVKVNELINNFNSKL
jgi:hypothetical protein